MGVETNMSCVRPYEEKGEEKRRREGKWKKKRKEKKPVAMLWLPGFQLGTSLGTKHTTQVLGSVCLDMYVRGWAVMASAPRMVRFGAQGYVTFPCRQNGLRIFSEYPHAEMSRHPERWVWTLCKGECHTYVLGNY